MESGMKFILAAVLILTLGGCVSRQTRPPNEYGHLANDPRADPEVFCHSGPRGQTAACVGAAITTAVAREALR
jgi:hypothetical protein